MKYCDIPLTILLYRGDDPKRLYPECDWFKEDFITDLPWKQRWIKGFPRDDGSPEIISLHKD